MITIHPTTKADQTWMRQLTVEQWGGETVVGHGLVYYPHQLAGFMATIEGERVGLLTYHMADGACEIVTLNSFSVNARVARPIPTATR